MRHLRIYRAIRLIARTGSIRKAAEALAVSPSALNRSVQAFEEEMTLPVFERVPGGVRLTTAGELLLDLLERHLVEFDDFRTQLASLREGLSGLLRISLGSDIGAGAVLAAVQGYEAAFPSVSVEITTEDDSAALMRRDVDLAILTNPQTDDGVEVVHALRLRLAAWDAGAQAWPDGLPTGLWALAGRRLLLPPPHTGSRQAVDHALRRNRLAAGVVSTLPAAQVAQHLVGGDAVAIFPDPVFAAAPPGLRRLTVEIGSVQLAVLRPARLPMIRPAQAFLTVLQRKLEGAGG
jgi:DNA-binding transcriptional LysR family regulator